MYMKGPEYASLQTQDQRLPGAGQQEQQAVAAHGYKVSPWSEECAMELAVMAAQHSQYTKTHWIVHYRMVGFIACGVKSSSASHSAVSDSLRPHGLQPARLLCP